MTKQGLQGFEKAVGSFCVRKRVSGSAENWWIKNIFSATDEDLL
jgi:hypothetical protein